MRTRLLVLVGVAALLQLPAACGSDPRPTEPCTSGAPDFEVLVSAAEGPLPADLVLLVQYGGGEETFELAHPGTPEVMFCHAADRDGNLVDAGPPDSGPGASGAGGEGGAASVEGVEALSCQIWSFGSARMIAETAAYPMQAPLELTSEKGACTLKAPLELVLPDGGI